MGGAGHAGHFAHVGHLTGLDETFEKANQANRHGPELRAFDRYGMRINAIEFHPAYHDLMHLAISNKVHNFAWHYEDNAGHVGQSVLTYMFSQPEGGVMVELDVNPIILDTEGRATTVDALLRLARRLSPSLARTSLAHPQFKPVATRIL